MTTPARHPWQQIPAADYEAHMREVGQSAALRALFRDVYASRRPRRLAVLGCTTGSDLGLVDPAATELAVGVDVNGEYLAIAAARLAPFGSTVRLVHGDVLTVEIAGGPFDLIHAALLLEYVDPRGLFERVRGWLAPAGVCSVICQEPALDLPAVSATPYESLRVLADHMVLRGEGELTAAATAAGLRLIDRSPVRLPSGKVLSTLVFA
jgi:SAM-dependent methyltransferase